VAGVRQGRHQAPGEENATMSLVPDYRSPYGKGRRIMPLFNVFVVLVVVGVILWLANAYILKGEEHE
jgi:lipoprotein signal peptidase